MKIFFSSIVTFFLVTLSYAQGGAARVAFIDMEYILKYTPEYTEASAQLSVRAEAWQKEVEGKKQLIKKQKDNLAAERILLTRDLIEDKEEEIATLENELYQFQQAKFGTEGDYITQKVMLTKPIQDEVFSVVQDIAEARKFDYVLDKNAETTMLLGAKRYDISDLIIRRMVTARRKQNMTPKQVAEVEEAEKQEDAIALRQSRREEQQKRKEEAERQMKAEAKAQKQQANQPDATTTDNESSAVEMAKRMQEEKIREAEEKRKQADLAKKEKIEAQKQAVLEKQKEIEQQKKIDAENKKAMQLSNQQNLQKQQEDAQREKQERERKLLEEKERKKQEALNQQKDNKNEALESLLDQKRKDDLARKAEADKRKQEADLRKQQQIDDAIKAQEERRRKNEQEQEERKQKALEQRRELEKKAQH